MVDVEAGRFTVGVFQDVAWAKKGIEELKRIGIPAAAVTIVARTSPEAAALIEQELGGSGSAMDISGVGPAVARGPMIDVLNGPSRDLTKTGIAGTMRRVGFQPHDGRIFET